LNLARVQLFTGCLIKRGPDVRKNRLFNLRELLAKLVDRLQSRYRDIFYDDDDELIQADCDDEWRWRQKASAWYAVTYTPAGHRHHHSGKKAKAKAKAKTNAKATLLSFAWVVHEVLVEIKRSRQRQNAL
jgi:hypothetical protein